MICLGTPRYWIPDFEQYEIVQDGSILFYCGYDTESEYYGILTTRIDRGGYLTVRLHKCGVAYTKYVHRLLAETFIPNPEGKPFVNHKNGIKTDNSISNLEWTTHSENVTHAYQHGLNSFAKSIVDSATGNTYPSIKYAAKAIQMNYNTCCKRLKKNNAAFRLHYLG